MGKTDFKQTLIDQKQTYSLVLLKPSLPREEIVLSRLRIGHTRLTHANLFLDLLSSPSCHYYHINNLSAHRFFSCTPLQGPCVSPESLLPPVIILKKLYQLLRLPTRHLLLPSTVTPIALSTQVQLYLYSELINHNV